MPVHAVNKRHAVSTTTFSLCFLCVWGRGRGCAELRPPTSFSAGLSFFLVGLVALFLRRDDNDGGVAVATAAPRGGARSRSKPERSPSRPFFWRFLLNSEGLRALGPFWFWSPRETPPTSGRRPMLRLPQAEKSV